MTAKLKEALEAFGKGDYSRAVPELEKYAAEGDAAIQTILSTIYADGWEGHPPDREKARKWTEHAAANGDALAQLQLGFFYVEDGDKEKAFHWIRRASRVEMVAQYFLGAMHEAGYSGRREPRLAVLAYRRAMENGHVIAQIRLGVLAAMHGLKGYSRLQGCHMFLSGVARWIWLRLLHPDDPRILQ